MLRKAIYAGSFDPFTNGHLDMVKKASALFDHVSIVIGVNANKTRSFGSDLMKRAIEDTLLELSIENCTVTVYDGLVAEFARENGIHYMLRGLRNNMDYNYEENIAAVNKLLNPDLEYVYFRAENIAISSSMVKELYGYGRNVRGYLPEAVYAAIMNGG